MRTSKMHDRYLEDPPDLKTWIAQCGVCLAYFESKIKSEDNPHPYGAFCPQCKERGLIAPGVLHFKPENNFPFLAPKEEAA
jgi:hypothetical protein